MNTLEGIKAFFLLFIVRDKRRLFAIHAAFLCGRFLGLFVEGHIGGRRQFGRGGTIGSTIGKGRARGIQEFVLLSWHDFHPSQPGHAATLATTARRRMLFPKGPSRGSSHGFDAFAHPRDGSHAAFTQNFQDFVYIHGIAMGLRPH